MLKIFLVVFLIAGASLYWWRRRSLPLALLLFVASVFLSRAHWEIAGSTIRLEQVTALLLFAYFFLDLLRRNIRLRLPWQVLLVLALFPLMLLPSLLVSPAPWLSLKKTLLYLPYFLAFVAMVQYLPTAEKFSEAWRAFYVFGAAAVSISLLALYLRFLGIDLGMVRLQYGSHWLRGTMVIPNIMGSTAVIVFLAALVRLTGKAPGRKMGRAPDLAVLAVSFAVVMTSYTRAAWIGALAGMVLIFILRWKTLALRWGAAILLVLVGSGALVSVTTTGGIWTAGKNYPGMNMSEFGETEVPAYPGDMLDKKIPPAAKRAKDWVSLQVPGRAKTSARMQKLPQQTIVSVDDQTEQKTTISDKSRMKNAGASKQPQQTIVSVDDQTGPKTPISDESRKDNAGASKQPQQTTVNIDYQKKLKTLVSQDGRSEWLLWVTTDALNDWRLSPIIGRGTDSLMLVNRKFYRKRLKFFYIPITLVAILHDWGLLALVAYGLFLLVAFVRLTGTYLSPPREKWRDQALALLAVLITTTFMYQITTTMQLSIFWCLMAFYAVAISPGTWPAAEAAVNEA